MDANYHGRVTRWLDDGGSIRTSAASMSIYVKNSKTPLPDWIRGLITQVTDGNQLCAYVYWRRTATRSRGFGGGSTWDLFAVSAADGYVVDGGRTPDGYDAPAVELGREGPFHGGEDLGFTLRRIVAPEVPLPNTTVLPAKTVVVSESDLRFLAVPPCQEGSVLDAFDRLPFHQPGGPESELEVPPPDLWERELVSYFAHEFPDEFRAAADPLAAAKDMLLPAE